MSIGGISYQSIPLRMSIIGYDAAVYDLYPGSDTE